MMSPALSAAGALLRSAMLLERWRFEEYRSAATKQYRRECLLRWVQARHARFVAAKAVKEVMYPYGLRNEVPALLRKQA